MGDAVGQAGFNCRFLRIREIGGVVEVPERVDISPFDSALPDDGASRGWSGIRKRFSYQSPWRVGGSRQGLEDFGGDARRRLALDVNEHKIHAGFSHQLVIEPKLKRPAGNRSSSTGYVGGHCELLPIGHRPHVLNKGFASDPRPI